MVGYWANGTATATDCWNDDTTTITSVPYHTFTLNRSAITSDTSVIFNANVDEFGTDWRTCTGTSTIDWKYTGWNYERPALPKNRIAEIIRQRHAPLVVSGKTPIGVELDDREFRARETLKTILGLDAYHRFLKSGFVTARNHKSGYTYQIFHKTHGHKMTRAYKPGQPPQLLCIYLQGNFAPTDFVITLYLMAVNNDQRIWDIANKHGAYQDKTVLRSVDGRALTDIYRELKSVA